MPMPLHTNPWIGIPLPFNHRPYRLQILFLQICHAIVIV